MIATPPSIWRAAVTSYRDAVRALLAMPSLALVAFAIGLGQSVTEFVVLGDPEGRDAFAQVIAFALAVVWAFLLTPMLIGVHRFILLDEVTHGYPLEPGQPRFARFFGWSLALLAAVALFDGITRLSEALLVVAILIVLFFVGVFFALRIVILFPAIAVDAPGASWKNAYRDSKGHAWRIFLIFLVASLPMVIVMFGAIVLTGLTLGLDLAAVRTSGSFKVFGVLTYAAATALGPAVYVAIASRLYQWLGDAVKAPQSRT